MKHRLIRLFLPNGSEIFLSSCQSCPNAACLHQWMKRLCQIITTHPQTDHDNPPSSRHDGENRLVHFRKITTFRTHNNTFSKVKFDLGDTNFSQKSVSPEIAVFIAFRANERKNTGKGGVPAVMDWPCWFHRSNCRFRSKFLWLIRC